MQRKLLVKLGQNFFTLLEYREDRKTILILLVWSEIHRSGVSFFAFTYHCNFSVIP
jgi:hypothetical protein